MGKKGINPLPFKEVVKGVAHFVVVVVVVLVVVVLVDSHLWTANGITNI